MRKFEQVGISKLEITSSGSALYKFLVGMWSWSETKVLRDSLVYCKLTNWLFLKTYSVKCYSQQVSVFSLVLSAPGSETCNICKEIVVTAFWQKRRYFKRCILRWHTSEMSGENLQGWILPQWQPVLIFFNFVFLAFFCICCVIRMFLYGFKRLSYISLN